MAPPAAREAPGALCTPAQSTLVLLAPHQMALLGVQSAAMMKSLRYEIVVSGPAL